MGNGQNKECIFCKIAEEKEDGKILKENEDLIIFKDHRPASAHHYLVVPKRHFGNVKTLKDKSDIEMIEDMVKFGEEFLVEQEGDLNDMRKGFHWPPIVTVEHLHLHIISPAKSMGLLQNFIFKENSMHFVPPKYVTDRIQSLL